MKKLKDILGTKYIYDSYVKEFAKVLSQETELDLADCVFTPPAERLLRSYYGKVYFINSADSTLNRLLLSNNGCLTARLDNLKTLEFNFKNVEDFTNMLKHLDKEGHYKLGEGRDSVTIATAVILVMMYPDMLIDVDNRLSDIFSFARNEWLKCNEHHDEYWLVDNTALQKLTANEDGKFVLPDKHVVKENILVQMYNVMPIDFGTRVIIKDDEFRPIFQNALRVLDMHHESERRMIDYLERRDLSE